jgi:hypothetical protein
VYRCNKNLFEYFECPEKVREIIDFAFKLNVKVQRANYLIDERGNPPAFDILNELKGNR